MGKTGGGRGTNQHAVRGASQANHQDTLVVDGLVAAAIDRQWTKQSAGHWRSPPYVVVNHPRVFPRGWTLISEGSEVGRFKTLAAARDEAARRDVTPPCNIDRFVND